MGSEIAGKINQCKFMVHLPEFAGVFKNVKYLGTVASKEFPSIHFNIVVDESDFNN